MDAFKLRSVKICSQILIAVVGSVSVVYLLLGQTNPFDSHRSYKTYADHFQITYNSHERFQSLKHLPPEEFIKQKFANEKSLSEIIMHMPQDVLEMSWLNIKDFPQSFLESMNIGRQQRRPFSGFPLDPIWLLIVFLMISSAMVPRHRQNHYIVFDFFVLSLALVLKCLFISFLLHSWARYFLEICAIFMIWICFIPVPRIKHFLWTSILIFICCLTLLITINYNSTFAYFGNGRPNEGRQALSSLKQLQAGGQVKKVLGGYGIGLWLDDVEHIIVHRICVNNEITTLKDCLNLLAIDTIVFEPEFRGRIWNTKFEKEFMKLKTSPEAFEFKKYSETASGIVVFTRQ